MGRIPARFTLRHSALYLIVLAGSSFCPRASLNAQQGQEPPCATRTVLVGVINRDGSPVEGLEAANFRAGFPVQILSVAHESRPRRIVILLDASGSMLRGMANSLSVAVHMASYAPANSAVSLLTFGGRIVGRVDFAGGRQGVLQELENIRLGRTSKAYGTGRTALYDAILEAVKTLGPSSEGDVIYAITDGGENASHNRHREVDNALLGAHLRLFAFVLASPGARTPEEMSGPYTLREFVLNSGGNFAYAGPLGVEIDGEHPRPADDAAAMDVALRRLYGQMTDVYRLEIKLAAPVDKLRSWKLELVERLGVNKKNLHLLYPHKLMPCNANDSPH